jgi:anti-sigma regulatory factor (Ser/Thr protein kinase)/ABC-type transporter Mla MlaB component
VTGAGGGTGRPAARDVVNELQQALLPAGLPVLPQARIAARYLPAAREHVAGGDWFDAVVLPRGLIALVVGDVAGGGIAAAAAMGQLRAVLNDLLITVPDLAAVLQHADAFAARVPALFAATAAVAVLDPADGTLRYAACGHPPPLVTGPDGDARFLDGGHSGPLGTGAVPVLATAALRPGELVMLYSDGLAARPGRTPAEAMTDLAKVAAGAAGADAPDRVCQATVELLAGTGGADDVTVLAAQRLAAPVPALHLDLPAAKSSLSEARRGFGEWLAEVDSLASDRDGLQLGLGEVVANAIEHAYPPGTAGTVEIDAEVSADGMLECRVTDHGRWREPGPGEDRGNGLMLAAHLAGDLQVSHPLQPAAAAPGSRGTVVTLRHRLSRPAVLMPAFTPEPDARPAAVVPPLRVSVDAAGHAAVSGPADSTNADRLTGRLLAACRGGTLPLTADLTGVTSLASAGVQVLFQVRDRLAAHGQELTLVTAPGGPAAAVLDLVCLPYAGGAMP